MHYCSATTSTVTITPNIKNYFLHFSFFNHEQKHPDYCWESKERCNCQKIEQKEGKSRKLSPVVPFCYSPDFAVNSVVYLHPPDTGPGLGHIWGDSWGAEHFQFSFFKTRYIGKFIRRHYFQLFSILFNYILLFFLLFLIVFNCFQLFLIVFNYFQLFSITFKCSQ